jgi:hypothetical protein
MAVAFVLLNTETGTENEVLEGLKKIEAVKEATSFTEFTMSWLKSAQTPWKSLKRLSHGR